MKRHFAFVVPPAHGHVNPTLPLVEELTRRGHQVSYAAAQSFLPQAEDAGAQPVALPGEMDPGILPQRKLTAEALVRVPLSRAVVLDARRSFPVLAEHFQHERPDAVCFEMMPFTGRMLADKLAVPGVALVPNLAANEHFSLRDRMMPEELKDSDVLAGWGKQMQDFAAEYGLTVQPHLDAQPAELNLVFIPRSFQLEGDTFDSRFRFLGPALGKREHADAWTPASPGKPLVFISLGTVPANVEVRPGFPQPAVLRHASVFLTHAGMNSTMESLHFGVPMAAVPQMPEQAANADRAEALGLGRRLPADLTAAGLREAVEALAGDAQIRATVATMRRELANCGGPAAGADALEAHLS